MTKKEERVVVSIALVLFLVVVLAVFQTRFLDEKTRRDSERVESQKEGRELSENDLSSETVNIFYKNGVLSEGNVTEANKQHADCFVSVRPNIKREASNKIHNNKEDVYIVVYYNNEYVLPDYDSLDFAKDMSAYMQSLYKNGEILLKRSQDKVLLDAMQPAVVIECNVASPEIVKLLEQGMKYSLKEE